MIRKAFRMSVHKGQEAEYERRHNPVWQDLADTLAAHGVSTAVGSSRMSRRASR